MTLKEVLNEFSNDSSWNTENTDGTHRFDEKIAWIEDMVNEYANHFHLSVDDVITVMEKKRTYSWPNYYQKANFPDVTEFDKLIGIFNTVDEFNEYAKIHWKGFKCPHCGEIGSDPQNCVHRLKEDGICDWAAYGLISSEDGVIILENSFMKIPIFEPVEK